jgi:hypothetical protein
MYPGAATKQDAIHIQKMPRSIHTVMELILKNHEVNYIVNSVSDLLTRRKSYSVDTISFIYV